MGWTDPDAAAATDSRDRERLEKPSPGFFGRLELAQPVYHPYFINTVVDVLKCVSYETSELRLSRDSPQFKRAQARGRRVGSSPGELLRAMVSESQGVKQCPTTGQVQPDYKVYRQHFLIEARRKVDESSGYPALEEVRAERAWDILRKITDTDARALGLAPEHCRPEWMILRSLPVSPPTVRPAVEMEASGMESHDDITSVLNDIVKTNIQLQQALNRGAASHETDQLWQAVSHHVWTMMNNTFPGVPVLRNKQENPVKSIAERLKGKHGRVRWNLMGKRVDFSARSVITGDANIGIDELGVPYSVAANLTFPEAVTPQNRDRLQAMVAAGRNPPLGTPGAQWVKLRDGQVQQTSYATVRERLLEVGDVVGRQLATGDVVLFNRQPSLHKMSMMGHRVRVLPYSTFRMNVTVTSPYNADFDGDEMNMHVPQSHEARAEMRELMMVPRNLVSGQANKPVVGMVQDNLVGARMMTVRDCFLDRATVMSVCLHLEDWDGRLPVPAILAPRPLWTGKQIFSLMCPDINLRSVSSWGAGEDEPDSTPEDTRVLIERGELLTGVLCKNTLGTSSGGLVHTIWLQLGADPARLFLNHCNFIVTAWLVTRGFSVGVGDCVVESDTMKAIDDAIEAAKLDVGELITRYKQKKLEAGPGKTVQETFEEQVSKRLNEARNETGKLVREAVPETNNIKRMASSGSKGKDINLAQIIACVAQQNVDGRRIKEGFKGRTLPHFPKGDLGPEARGFVQNSYLFGLTPQEFFFHACGGREGLIDTAVKTATSGYIQRKFIKSLEDLIVGYDGTVRNALGEVVQFLYGEDGLDPAQLERTRIAQAGMPRARFDRETEWPLGDSRWCASPGSAGLSAEHILEVKGDAKALELVARERAWLLDDWHALTREVVPEEDQQGGAAAVAVAAAADPAGPAVAALLARTDQGPALLPPGDGSARVVMPCNLGRLLWTAQTRFGLVETEREADGRPGAPRPGAHLSIPEVIRRVGELVDRLITVPGADALSVVAQRNATRLVRREQLRGRALSFRRCPLGAPLSPAQTHTPPPPISPYSSPPERISGTSCVRVVSSATTASGPRPLTGSWARSNDAGGARWQCRASL